MEHASMIEGNALASGSGAAAMHVETIRDHQGDQNTESVGNQLK